MTHSFFIRLPRPALLLVPGVLLIALLAACGGDGADNREGLPGSPDETLSVLLMAHDVEVGEARLPIVVFLSNEDMTRVEDRAADLSFEYRMSADDDFQQISDVQWREWPVRGGAYTGYPEFDQPGIWEIQVTLDEGSNKRIGSTFLQVEQDGSAPSVGDPAPVTVTKTASTVDEVRQISSALEPDPRFYGVSLDEALSNGRPTVVLFSTPAFCQTQTCGPQLDALGRLMDEHGGVMEFIHVEIFGNIREMLDTGDSTIGEVAQPVNDWGLVTEPWTFFVDADGIITARFEQFTTFEELSEAADSLIASG